MKGYQSFEKSDSLKPRKALTEIVTDVKQYF